MEPQYEGHTDVDLYTKPSIAHKIYTEVSSDVDTHSTTVYTVIMVIRWTTYMDR